MEESESVLAVERTEIHFPPRSPPASCRHAVPVPFDMTTLPSESYHQDYYTRNARQPYCQAVVAPKVAKARRSALAKLG